MQDIGEVFGVGMGVGVGVGQRDVSYAIAVMVVVADTGGSVVALLMVTVEVLHGGVVSMHEQSVLTKELACWMSEEKSGSRGSGFLLVNVVVGLGFVRLLRAGQDGVMVIVVMALAVK